MEETACDGGAAIHLTPKGLHFNQDVGMELSDCWASILCKWNHTHQYLPICCCACTLFRQVMRQVHFMPVKHIASDRCFAPFCIFSHFFLIYVLFFPP